MSPDPVFIFGLGMGITGAAVATVISQSVSTIITLEYFVRKKSYTNLSIRLYRFSLHIYSEISRSDCQPEAVSVELLLLFLTML